MIDYCSECIKFPGRGERCGKAKKKLSIGANKACSFFIRKKPEVEMLKPGDPLFPETKMVEFLKTDTNGKVMVIERKPKGSNEGINLVLEVTELKAELGRDCPYSYRYV